jgi:hypothetical protein
MICEWWIGKYLDGIGRGLFVILLRHQAAGTEEDLEILESRWPPSRSKFKQPSHYSMIAITLTENFWPLVAHCILAVTQRKKNSLSFYRQHYHSFHLVPFRLSVVCAVSYTGVVVYLSTWKIEFEGKITWREKGPEINFIFYCVCNYAALSYLYICVFVIFSYFDLCCETYKLINLNELRHEDMYCGIVQKENTNICHEKYIKLREFIFKVDYLPWNMFF